VNIISVCETLLPLFESGLILEGGGEEEVVLKLTLSSSYSVVTAATYAQ
jgi:hypothetical protein